MAGWSLATRVGACGAALAEDVYPRDGIAGFGGGLLCGALSTDTDVRRALSFRTGMAQYSQRRLRRPSGHIHHLTSELRGVRGARLNRKQCIDELVRLDGGSGASSSAESRTASSAPHLHRHFDPSILAGPAAIKTSHMSLPYTKEWEAIYGNLHLVSLKWDIKAGKVEEIWEVRKVPKPRKSLTAMKGTKRFKVLSKLKKLKPNKSSASSSGK